MIAEFVDKITDLDRAIAVAVTVDTMRTYPSKIRLQQLLKDMANYSKKKKYRKHDDVDIPDEALFKMMTKVDNDSYANLKSCTSSPEAETAYKASLGEHQGHEGIISDDYEDDDEPMIKFVGDYDVGNQVVKGNGDDSGVIHAAVESSACDDLPEPSGKPERLGKWCDQVSDECVLNYFPDIEEEYCMPLAVQLDTDDEAVPFSPTGPPEPEPCMPAVKKMKAVAPEMPKLDAAKEPSDFRSHHDPDDETNRYKQGMEYNMHVSMAAQLVKDKETLKSQAVRDAVTKEWDNLVGRQCWDLSKAEKLSEVRKRADREGKLIHIGSLCELCYLKGSELEGKEKKYTDRVVFLGGRVRDQHGATAVFEEMTSSPASMEASRFCDAFGSLPGHKIMQAYAEQSYTQAELNSKNATWIKVPPRMRKDD